MLTRQTKAKEQKIAQQAKADAVKPQEERIEYPVEIVSPAYFETLGIQLAAGRTFGIQDHADAPSAIDAGVLWRWTDAEAAARDAEVRAVLRALEP